jgi:DNA-binding NarL/FixJ family response regulator
MPKINIMLVEDHKLLRETWREILTNSEFIVIAETGDSKEAIELAEKLKPQIILMDVGMKPLSGIDITEKINWLYPQVRVIGLSMHVDLSIARKMLKAGAMGYVCKNSSWQELIHSINLVHSGQKYLCSLIQSLTHQDYLDEAEKKPDLDLLTKREKDIAARVQEGNTSRAIADQLELSYKTVEVHRHHILKKLRVKNTAALVNYLNGRSQYLLAR